MKPAILKRVWKEVKEANADFFNLRTVISPDLIDDDVTRFYFIMLPNDGAMAHLTLVGKFNITDVSNNPRSCKGYVCCKHIRTCRLSNDPCTRVYLMPSPILIVE
jgi:hypothetical protein